MTQVPFRDRRAAGRVLAGLMPELRDRDDVLVLGLPRGGVPVAYEVAMFLQASLDIALVRKLGVPGHEELAMGAIASGNVRVLNEGLIRQWQIGGDVVDAVAVREAIELRRREHLYRGERPPPVIRDQVVVLVDDGLATGMTMRAAIMSVRQEHPAMVIVAVPVGDATVCRSFVDVAEKTICAATPDHFRALGLWYEDFGATPDTEVQELLAAARRR